MTSTYNVSAPSHHRLAVVSEFLRALRNPRTYSPRKNLEVIFGFLWGLPIPLFTLAIHMHAGGTPWTVTSVTSVLHDNPLYVVLILHPFLFAIVFGAMGTMRSLRDAHIRGLLAEVATHCDELGAANARLTELDRLKTEFLANVTHELKSPLVTAVGYTERILGEHLGPITDRQRKGLEVSKRNLVRLRELIDEILDFSRLEAGVARFEMATISLKEVVNTAFENVMLKARDRGLTISAELPEAGAQVKGDKGKLTQVVVNLLDNAIKFSNANSEVKVSLHSAGTQWHMAVSDQGAGIPPESVSKLFERFYQVDGSLSRPHNGVGLGLVIVKKIVEMHGGNIWIESEVGKGTTVHIELPDASAPALNALKEKKEVAYATNSAD